VRIETRRAASAQRIEVSFNGGYSASEAITTDERTLLGQLYDTVAVDSGASVNFTFGVNVTPQAQVEFLWARQNSRLQADGPAGKLPFSELAVYNYMFNFVYNAGDSDAAVRPYFFGGVGATNYSFGEILVPGASGALGAATSNRQPMPARSPPRNPSAVRPRHVGALTTRSLDRYVSTAWKSHHCACVTCSWSR
jgi:hypothetical protein